MPNRFWIKHEVRKRNPDGTTSIYCRRCGREIMRAIHPTIMSVTKCQLCVLKEQGIINAEDYVLAQYKFPGPDKPPVPIDADDSIAGGVLLLYPEEKMEQGAFIPPVGGIIGTVKQMFRTLGFALAKPAEPPKSKQIATETGRTGLFGPNKSRRL